MTQQHCDLTGLRSTTDKIAEMMAYEYSTKEIAYALGLSPNHVRVTKSRIRRNYGEGPHDD